MEQNLMKYTYAMEHFLTKNTYAMKQMIFLRG